MGIAFTLKREMTKPINVRAARRALASADEDLRNAVLYVLEALAASEITDILSWDDAGNVVVKSSDSLPLRAKKAIKKIRVTGKSVEVEMHDKIATLRLLAKHAGLLEADQNMNRPTLIGINITGAHDATLDKPDDSGYSEGGGHDGGGSGSGEQCSSKFNTDNRERRASDALSDD